MRALFPALKRLMVILLAISVIGCGSGGLTDPAPSPSPTPPSPATTPVPGGLTATAISSTRIDLSWTAATGASGYRVYKAGVKLADVTVTALTDSGLVASTQYCYSVSSYDGAGNESAQSSQVCATTYLPPPSDPAALTVKAVSPTRVDLSWTASAGASQYKIYRNDVLLASTASSSYSDMAAVANTPYVYRVTAIDGTGSESSGEASSLPADTGLTVPSTVTATVDSSTQISLSWVNSGGSRVAGYKVYKGGTLLGAVAPVTTTSVVDAGLTPNTQYCYSVSATDSAGKESAQSTTVCGTTEAPPVPAYIDLLISTPQLNSDNSTPVTLTALVKDSQNRAMAGQTVGFTAESGILTEINAVTDQNGMATAKLATGGNPSYRTIALTATTGSKSATNTVAVTGTNISIDPPSFSLPFNDPAGRQIVISLKDSAGGAIANKSVSLASNTGKSAFTPIAPYVTDNSGQVTVTVTNATDTVGDVITASAIGVSSQATLTINSAKLTVGAPAAGAEVTINTAQSFTVTYTEGGTAVTGKTVYFTATRGTLTASSASTDGAGTATVSISSVNSGPAVLTAYTTGNPQASAQVSITFVTTAAAKMDLSAFPAIINTNAVGQTGEQSLIKAIVRDANDNLVKGKTVDFRIVQDASAGTLSKSSAVTDMYGTATTNYIAGGVTGGLNNVQIVATVQDTPSVTRTTTLTVGGQALFISLATGPVITKVDPNKYQKDYAALVTDAAGRPVENAVVTASVTPMYYWKGYYTSKTGVWVQINTISLPNATDPFHLACANEDGITQNPLFDYNGILNTGEDQNSNSRLDPGNIAAVTAAVTDSTGHSTISLFYARDYARWVDVKLEVRASLYGSTASAVQYFTLPGAATDYSDINSDPPGNPSPFGSNTTCYAALTAIRLSDTKIGLNWDPSGYAASYNIYRDPNNVLLASRIVNSYTKTSYEDTVAAGTYCYEIKQVDSAGVETPLAQAGNRVCVASAPTAPTGVTAVALSPSQIQVSWADVGASGYRIYQDGVKLQDSVSRTIVSGNLTANTRYCYQVSSLDVSGAESAKSDEICAITELLNAAPPVPTGLAGTGGSVAGPPVTYKVDLSWNASPGAECYRIYRDGSLQLCATGPSTTATDVKEVLSQVCYRYTISALDSAGNESNQSTQVVVCVP